MLNSYEKTILDNPYQDLNSIAQEKPTDCAIVSFFDNDVANGNESTKQNTFIADSNDDLKQEAIAYLQAQCPDVTASAISETIDALTARFSLTSQHEIVNAVLMTLGKITEDEAWNYDQQGRCGVAISHPETHASLQNSTPQAINNSGVGDTVSDDHAKVDQLGQDCHKSILSQRLNRVASQPNSDNLNLIEVFGVCGTDHKAMIDVRQNSTSHTDGGSEMTNTAERHHDKSTFSKQAYHKTSAANLTAEDIKMPVVEKEVLRKDWASLADQNFYEGVLPDSQKIALVAIIDYVKRKGVIIGSDTEIYRWLYHTVSNHERYYSRATNFKHLCNILIKQLMNRRFERPSGFNAWEQRLKQKEGRLMSQRE